MFLYYNSKQNRCSGTYERFGDREESRIMRGQKSIGRMNNGELRFYRCMLRLRRERRRRLLISMFAMLAITCVIIRQHILFFYKEPCR